jgi:hypothetical protein
VKYTSIEIVLFTILKNMKNENEKTIRQNKNVDPEPREPQPQYTTTKQTEEDKNSGLDQKIPYIKPGGSIQWLY